MTSLCCHSNFFLAYVVLACLLQCVFSPERRLHWPRFFRPTGPRPTLLPPPCGYYFLIPQVSAQIPYLESPSLTTWSAGVTSDTMSYCPVFTIELTLFTYLLIWCPSPDTSLKVPLGQALSLPCDHCAPDPGAVLGAVYELSKNLHREQEGSCDQEQDTVLSSLAYNIWPVL